MTSLSDTLTVGLVLVLLFGSIALYLYTRIQQSEQKISLLESILLDIKMSSEIKSYTELPAATELSTEKVGGGAAAAYVPFDEEENDDTDAPHGNKTPSVSGSVEDSAETDQYKSVIAEAIQEDIETKDAAPKASSASYDAMTIKELKALAKTRGITSADSMKKNSLIEALKTSDRTLTIDSGSNGTQPGSFLETAAPFQGGTTEESQ
jgi:hypothetical protein